MNSSAAIIGQINLEYTSVVLKYAYLQILNKTSTWRLKYSYKLISFQGWPI
jgi:hypothetical protein